jgi:hypothetical protein
VFVYRSAAAAAASLLLLVDVVVVVVKVQGRGGRFIYRVEEVV